MKDLTPADVDRRTDTLLEEAEAYFMGEGGVRNAAAAIAARLAEAGIDYAIPGAIALGEHDSKRLTVAADILIRRVGPTRYGEERLGRGDVEGRPGG